jgi:hypothetical protein
MHEEFTLQLLKDLYEQDLKILNAQGQPVKITPAGDINILAIGYKGTIALRKARGWHIENDKIIIPPFPHQKETEK